MEILLASVQVWFSQSHAPLPDTASRNSLAAYSVLDALGSGLGSAPRGISKHVKLSWCLRGTTLSGQKYLTLSP